MFPRSSHKLSYQCNLPDSAFTLVDGKEFCSQCQTSIVDFTVMTDEEIRAYLAARPGSVCVKIDSDQLRRVKGQQSTLRKNLALAATAALLSLATESHAQTDTVKTEQVANSSSSDASPAAGIGSDTSKVASEGYTPEEPVVKRKPLKRKVLLRTRRREFYVMNRAPFFGSRYIGWRGKF